MTTTGLVAQAKLGGSNFALKERILLSLIIKNTGTTPITIPQPFCGSDAAASLELCQPSGIVRTLRFRDVSPMPGVAARLERTRVLPGRAEVFTLDVADRFELVDAGNYELTVSCMWTPEETWRSEKLCFSIRRPIAGFLEVTASEAAALGYHAILWVEPDGREGRVLLFGDGPFAPRIFGARPVICAPRDAKPALSTAPAGLPQIDRWIVWTSGSMLTFAFLSEEDEIAVPPRTVALPAGVTAPRIVRPVLAEHAPNELCPRCAIGVLATNAAGGADFLLAAVGREGAPHWSQPVTLPGQVLGAWATAVSAPAGVVVLALAGRGEIRVMKIAVFWDGSTGIPTDLFTVPADRLFLGDVRSDLHNRMWVGLLVERQSRWARVSFSIPGVDPQKNRPGDEWYPARDAQPVHARVDGAGHLHLLYRQGGRLCYLPPGSTEPTWSRETLHSDSAEEQLLLRPRHPTLLVYRDVRQGTSILRIDSQTATDPGRSIQG